MITYNLTPLQKQPAKQKADKYERLPWLKQKFDALSPKLQARLFPDLREELQKYLRSKGYNKIK